MKAPKTHLLNMSKLCMPHEFDEAYQNGVLKAMYSHLAALKGLHGASEKRRYAKKDIADQIEMMKDKGYIVNPPPECKKKNTANKDRYTIDDLTWVYDWWYENKIWMANTFGQFYRIVELKNGLFKVKYPLVKEPFQSLECAKAWCQNDHEDIIVNFLTPAK